MLTSLGGLVFVMLFTIGPVLVLVALQTRRDHRRSALLGAVSECLAGREFRGRVAVEARAGLFSRRSMVILDMRACSHDEIWGIVTRLFRRLPRPARLVVKGTVGRQLPATLILEAPRTTLPVRASRPSVAAS